MANLAIKGHTTRGIEIMEIFLMLGGEDVGYNCNVPQYHYYVNNNGNIYGTTKLLNIKCFKIYTLEEFIEKFPYKVGDKVTHNMGKLMKIVRMYWDTECNVVRYDIQSPVENNYKFKAMLAEHLKPYKE